MSMELLLPSLILPLSLSALLLTLGLRHPSLRENGLPAIWLVSLLWIQGLNWPPTSALEWLPAIALASMIINLGDNGPARRLAYQLALVLALLLIAWPVLSYQLEMAFILALLLATTLASLAATAPSPQQPATILALATGGLALAAALDGSLLIGQLAGALTTALLVFALMEWLPRTRNNSLGQAGTRSATLLFTALLAAAWLYAELATGPSLLLLLAPLGLRLGPTSAATLVLGALIWLITGQPTGESYY